MEHNTFMLIVTVGGGLLLMIAGWRFMNTPIEKFYDENGRVPTVEEYEKLKKNRK